MNEGDFPERFRRALGLPWALPPEAAGQSARSRPDEASLPPPPPDAPARTVPAPDVRSTGTDDAGVRHASLPGLDTSILVQPPHGDDLWTVRGRVWLQDETDVPIHVALVQGEHVLDQIVVTHGGRFLFRDVVAADWSIEFRWGDRAAVVRGEAL